jgi:hypothetical protein
MYVVHAPRILLCDRILLCELAVLRARARARYVLPGPLRGLRSRRVGAFALCSPCGRACVPYAHRDSV